jgi:DNA-binding NtrC family response regulator
VTDLVMNRMNGGELIRRLVPLRPEMQVIIMSGFPDQILAQHALTPLAPTLQKPFLPKRLLTTIEEILAKPKSERTVARLAQRSPPGGSQKALVSGA